MGSGMQGICTFSHGKHADYLSDESKLPGVADSISFPTSEEEVSRIVRDLGERGVDMTLQGGRTGLSGGAVPRGGHVMNLSRMNKITGARYSGGDELIVSLQPGVPLSALAETVWHDGRTVNAPGARSAPRSNDNGGSRRYFFPPDPTETTASLGGIVSCNAAGCRSYGYGSARRYVAGLRVVLADGSIESFRRGETRCTGLHCRVNVNGADTEFDLPGLGVQSPRMSTGYPAERDMDIVDLFIGAEGTLGIITGMDLRLIPAPAVTWGCACFFASSGGAYDFVAEMRLSGASASDATLAGLEYFAPHSLALVEQQRSRMTAIQNLPHVDPAASACIYFEIHGDSDEAANPLLERAMTLAEACGGSAETAWAATRAKELEALSAFRHAVPEAENLVMNDHRRQNPGLLIIRADMAVPENHLRDMMDMFTKDLEGSEVRHTAHGHIGNNSLDICLLPEGADDYEAGIELRTEWAKEVARWSGTLSAAHGIGKQKNGLVRYFVDPHNLRIMRKMKEAFDRRNVMNRLNIFEG